LSENGVSVPEIVSVSIPDRLLIQKFVEGRSVLDIIIEVMSSENLKEEYENLAHQTGRTIASIHSLNIVLGDCKPENFILDNQRKLYVVDLEQGERHGDPAWDVAEFLYFSGHFGNKFSNGFERFVEKFIEGYVSIGKRSVLREAALSRYSKSFIAWTPVPTIQEISERLRKA
jgi:tRNA A-37 threonylcarbamoyl transferase component Bud32